MHKRQVTLAAGIILVAAACTARADIVSPREGGAYPEIYRELVSREKGAFRLKRAWTVRRERQRAGDPRFASPAPSAATPLRDVSSALGGTLRIPVVLGLYADVASAPIAPASLDRELFTGPWTPGTMTEYWSDVSFGLLDVTGGVYDWVPLSGTEAYYTGGLPYFGLYPGVSHTGGMIKEIVDARDEQIDFGAFDNDGPDGIPNSGDDDGFVDVLLVVHPTFGAECNYSAHMWSHSWIYSAWPESGYEPYRTNDARAGGGRILIDDYIIVPALSCNGSGMIEIGVICHEIGHAIGLPDLYDSNGSGSGIGFWGLMGSGNWNTPASPAHPDVWCREQLGWLNPIEIDWRSRSVSLRPIETHAEAAKLALPTKRFRPRRSGAGGALVCGYTAAEALARGWPGGEGYGNGWRESMIHEFSVDASRPVSASYDISVDIEPDYDFAMLVLECAGASETLAQYTGSVSRRETIDIGSHLPAGPVSFTLRLLFTSDESYSDEDGSYDSQAGYSFRIDNVRLAGGGLDYGADFEIDADGWREEGDPAEYFIVENRRRIGFDAFLRGQGMLVWHAENSIAWTYLGNTGGVSNTQARGLVLEEADGLYNLLQSGNAGDAGDPFPGSTGNTSFGPTTIPRSYSNGGVATPVAIQGVMIGSSGEVSATFVGGMFAPIVASVSPNTIDKLLDAEAVLDVRGEGMLYGAACALARGPDTIEARAVDWRGENRLIATLPITELYAGNWDVVVTSGDGQQGALPEGVAVMSVYADASVVEGEEDIFVSWTLLPMDGIRGCLLYRSDNGSPFELVTPDTLRGEGAAYSYRDTLVELGVAYSYRIVTYLAGGIEEPYVLRGPYHIGSVIADASVLEGRIDLLVSWTLLPVEDIRGCLLYRSDNGSPFELVTADTLREEGGIYIYRDALVALGTRYSYRIVVYVSGGYEESYFLDGPYQIGTESYIGNYPNPFSLETTVRFFVPSSGRVEIDIYNVSGTRVDRLVNRTFARDTYELPWRPRERGIAAGVYFCVLRFAGMSRTVKMVYVP